MDIKERITKVWEIYLNIEDHPKTLEAIIKEVEKIVEEINDEHYYDKLDAEERQNL